MKIKLGKNAYGKNAVNFSKIIRHEAYHEFRQLSVNVSLQGDFETCHTIGDNSRILPTDTQKNTVFALAKDHFNGSIEDFGIFLARHFSSNNPQVSTTTIELTEHLYTRLSFDGRQHPHAYISRGNEKQVATVAMTENKLQVSSGMKDLLLLKTTDSGFENFIRDPFTTLKETDDRILATECTAQWVYANMEQDFKPAYESVRDTFLRTFAYHNSLSVQHTLYAIGEAVLQKHDFVAEISLIMPNKHHILANLAPFGMKNENEIFMATDEPYGYITGTVTRE
jgi:urate oxidase